MYGQFKRFSRLVGISACIGLTSLPAIAANSLGTGLTGQGQQNSASLQLQENLVVDKQALYARGAVKANYHKQLGISHNEQAKPDYVMIDNLGTFEPAWATGVMFNMLPRVDQCLYGAWVNNARAKRAIHIIANAAPRLQITNDFVSGKIKLNTTATLSTMGRQAQIMQQAVEASRDQYTPLLDAIGFCMSDGMASVKRRIITCDPEEEACPCYVPGQRGLKMISVDPAIDNQDQCSTANDEDDGYNPWYRQSQDGYNPSNRYN